jgi:hypothetical protein
MMKGTLGLVKAEILYPENVISFLELKESMVVFYYSNHGNIWQIFSRETQSKFTRKVFSKCFIRYKELSIQFIKISKIFHLSFTNI